MLKEAIEKLVSLKDNKIYEINGRAYSDNELELIEPPIYRPSHKGVNSLDGIVKLIQTEVERVNRPAFAHVSNYNRVEVFTTYDPERYYRDTLYVAESDTPIFNACWMDREEAIISLRSRFVRTEDTEYLIKLLSKVTEESAVTTADNGLSQTVEACKGIAILENLEIKPIVNLRPYRTFLEVEQPESQFLLRLREGGKVGLFEADGGMWKLQAKKNIADYLHDRLEYLIRTKNVIVME